MMHSITSIEAPQLLNFRTRDEEETRSFLRSKDIGFGVVRGSEAELDVRLRGINLPGAYVGYAHYGAEVDLWVETAPTFYWLQIPLRGRFAMMAGNLRTSFGSGHGAILSPSRQTNGRLRSEAGNTRLQVHLDSAALLDHLAVLLGRQPEAPICFSENVDLAGDYGRSLARYLLAALLDSNLERSALGNISAMRAFSQFIMTGLLLSQPNNYSEALHLRDRSIAPRDVKRAMDYIHANLDRDLSISDIAAASGVPARTLFMHFRDFGAGSPMSYVRDARFRLARELLSHARDGESIFSVAIRCGFGHMGRFAQEYRKRFGERPSDTLRRRAQ